MSDSTGQIDGAAVPVPGTADGAAKRKSHPQYFGDIVGGRGFNKVQNGHQQLQRIGADQHHSVADRFDGLHRTRHDIMGEIASPRRFRPDPPAATAVPAG